MVFTDKTIWITGASSGIGAALSQQLSQLGARLILSARNQEALEAVKARCANPADIRIQLLDLEDAESIKSAADLVLREPTRVDIMFHNGGISQRSLTHETTIAIDRRIMEINYFGTVILTKRLLAHFLQHGGGHFVVTSSMTGKFGFPLRSAYSASKHALHGYFDTLRAEQAGKGIGVTLVCPGFVRTRISQNALDRDGNPTGKLDANQQKGMTAETCAKKMIHAVRKGKKEILIGRERFLVHIKHLIPALYYSIVTKVKPT